MSSNSNAPDPLDPGVEVLPKYERILDLCAAHKATQANNHSSNPASRQAPACPLLALHRSLTAIHTTLSDPLRTLHPAPGQESLHELGMREMSRAFEGVLERGVMEVVVSGMEGPDVLAVVRHVEGIAGRDV